MQCVNCESIFFKTLETRVLPFDDRQPGEGRETITLLYKKRCKRCKHKYYYRKDFPGEATGSIAYSLWKCGRKINAPGASPQPRPIMLTGEYSSRVSKSADRNLAYLHKIERAKEIKS